MNSSSLTRLTARASLLAVLSLGTVASGPSSPPQYKVVNHFSLGGDGGWDFLTVDGRSRRVYVARSTRVMVVDADSGKLIGEIPDTPRVHGIALASELGTGFITVGGAHKVVVIDSKTLQQKGSVETGENPDAILYHPALKRVFVFNGQSKNVTVIDAASLQVLSTIPVSGKPEVAVYDNSGHVFVNIEDKGTVVVIDTNSNRVVNEWSLAPCDEPTGLAIDRKKQRLFASCSGNKVMAIMDSSTGKVLASVPIGAGSDGAEFDPSAGVAFSSNGSDGTLTVVGETAPGKFSPLQTVATQKSGRTIALDEKTHELFIPAAKVMPSATPGTRPTIEPNSFELLVVGR
jgi:YVTN family beta-propeller protein